MNIVGQVFKKRIYPTKENHMGLLLFMNVDEGIMVSGDCIKTIPVLDAREIIDCKVGDKIEINGKIEYRHILTPSGNLSYSDLPVIIPDSCFPL